MPRLELTISEEFSSTAVAIFPDDWEMRLVDLGKPYAKVNMFDHVAVAEISVQIEPTQSEPIRGVVRIPTQIVPISRLFDSDRKKLYERFRLAIANRIIEKINDALLGRGIQCHIPTAIIGDSEISIFRQSGPLALLSHLLPDDAGQILTEPARSDRTRHYWIKSPANASQVLSFLGFRSPYPKKLLNGLATALKKFIGARVVAVPEMTSFVMGWCERNSVRMQTWEKGDLDRQWYASNGISSQTLNSQSDWKLATELSFRRLFGSTEAGLDTPANRNEFEIE